MPTAAQAAQQLTPATLGQLEAIARLAVDMVRAVAQTGSGYYTQAVWDFQTAWNQGSDAISEALIALGSSARWVPLTDDGMYGPRTSEALWISIAGSGLPRPPRRASGMPAYYAQYRSLIETFIPPQTSVAEDILNEPPPAPPAEGVQTVPAEVFDAVENSSGSLVQEHVAVVSDGGEVPPELVGPPEVPSEGLVPLETELSMAETPIFATPRQGGVPVIALGVVAVALGGVMFWWTQRGGRRR